MFTRIARNTQHDHLPLGQPCPYTWFGLPCPSFLTQFCHSVAAYLLGFVTLTVYGVFIFIDLYNYIKNENYISNTNIFPGHLYLC